MITQANLDAACKHYIELKNRMRLEAPDDLDWYEGTNKDGWHYTSITLDNYLRLFYRVVWTSGFRAQTVFDKEEDYFSLLYKHLFPNGKYDSSNELVFLNAVAPVLGAHAKNRKNKAIVDLVKQISSVGWETFKQQYISPGPDVESRLLQLSMVGPKTVKLLLNQTGLTDVAKDDIWVTRFAEKYNYSNPHECVKLISDRVGDSQTTIDAVLFWAGRMHGLTVPRPESISSQAVQE